MINSFSGKYHFLSNFYMHPIEYEGLIYPSSEHAYHAAKSLDPATRLLASQETTARSVKKFGKTIALREDWDSIKLDVMTNILKIKFSDEELKKKLVDTGDDEIVEGNTWGDTYWGVCNGVGQNNLGKILMGIRAGFKMEVAFKNG